MDDKVQLSRETIVGDDVVNEDIYPNTNTKSVNDEQSGTSLNETIERIWAAINNKLARIVNSVNGRTGVVVLDSSDVGLENVDNISFNDIKSWVIDELTKQFGYKKIKLFANQAELEAEITKNNLDDLYCPFYIEKLNESTDTRPYIGCIVLDPMSNRLVYEMRPISGIGATDYSLQYETETPDSNTSGMKAGELRVKISSEEEVLYVRNESGDTYEQKGLSIDRSGMGGILHFYDGAYGTLTDDPSHPFADDGLISPDGQDEHGEDYPLCTIRIDGKLLGNYYLKDTSIHKNDIIVCNFDDYRTKTNNKYCVLNAENIYINTSNDYADCGDGYRVGDVITVINPLTDIRFEVSSIKDGLFEGPVKSVNLLYCKKLYTVGASIPDSVTYDTEEIVRYYQPNDRNEMSSQFLKQNATVTTGGTQVYQGDATYELANASYASGLKIHVKSGDWIPSQYNLPDDVDFELTMRGMCIGKVTNAPTRTSPSAQYVIELNSVRPLLGNSLKFGEYDTLHQDQISKCIDIQTRKGHLNQHGLWNEMLDVSGLSIAEDWGKYRYDGESAKLVDETAGNTLVEPGRFKRSAVLPMGVTEVMSNSQTSQGGLTVMTDMSLCIQPHEICAPFTSFVPQGRNSIGCALADNWECATPYIFPRYEHETPSYVGVNLFKIVEQKDSVHVSSDVTKYRQPYHFYNMSGLRVVNKFTKLTKSLVGKTTDSYLNFPSVPQGYDEHLESLPTSGGLMVNVGRGLDIRSYDEDGTDLFDKCGKVCVRTDNDTISVNDDNRLYVKINTARGLQEREWDPSLSNEHSIGINTDMKTVVFTNAGHLTVGINGKTYHDIDIFSNYHKVINLLQKDDPIGDDTGLSAYVNTKYGLGFTMNSNAPYALKIKIKADDIGGPNTAYRSMYTGLTDDLLVFDKDGVLRAPIDTSKGLKNTYLAKAMSGDTFGNVEVTDKGGIAINAGPGLTFTEDGALTLAEGYDLRPLTQGYDLDNLSVGTYCTESDEVGNSIQHRPAVTGDVGAFRVEHIKLYTGHFMQRLYAYKYPDRFYTRYCGTVSPKWSKWYVFVGTAID